MPVEREDILRSAIVALNAGDPEAALRNALLVLSRRPDEPRLHSLLGSIFASIGDFPSAKQHLWTALDTDATDTGARINLSRVLSMAGDYSGVLEVSTSNDANLDASMNLRRLRAYAFLQLGQLDEAVNLYTHILEQQPSDFESWNNLGTALVDNHDYAGAVTALRRALALNADSIDVKLNLAGALGRHRREGETIAILEQLIAEYPNDPRPYVELGSWLALLDRDEEAYVPLAQAVILNPKEADGYVRLALVELTTGRIAGAERSLERALKLAPDHEDAHLKLAILFETNNRLVDLVSLLTQVKLRLVDASVVAFIEALVLRRQGRLTESLGVAEHIRPNVEPVRAAQLRGELLDRLGDADAAWDWFVEMNRQAAIADVGDPVDRAQRYANEVRKTYELMKPSWCAGWPTSDIVTERPDPVFLVGSPRSGTTLLDTMLMGHNRITVLEEQPLLRIVTQHIGDLTRLPDLEAGEIADLRNTYFTGVDQLTDGNHGRLIIDKFPLHMNKVAIIHRLFPRAHFILAERHPFDVVLSTFMTNFRLNPAMCNYLEIETAALLYDLSMSCWFRSKEQFPIETLTVRYENVVQDREAELHRIVGFLGIDWSEEMLDNETIALKRGNIKTASYSQVTEKIYERGVWAVVAISRQIGTHFSDDRALGGTTGV